MMMMVLHDVGDDHAFVDSGAGMSSAVFCRHWYNISCMVKHSMDIAQQCYMWNAMKDQLISGCTNCFPTQLSAAGAKRGDDECDESNVTE